MSNSSHKAKKREDILASQEPIISGPKRVDIVYSTLDTNPQTVDSQLKVNLLKWFLIMGSTMVSFFLFLIPVSICGALILFIIQQIESGTN